MSRNREVVISRRAMLQLAAAGGAGLLILNPAAAFAAPPKNSPEKSRGAIDAYVAATASTGLTDLRGIHAEYRRAVARFPFALPSGWAFPAESGLKNIRSDDAWERGNGVAEAYLYWQSAVATSAYEAHLRGDPGGVERFLDTLESGYDTPVRRAVLEDPADGLVKIQLAAARRGDFRTLKSFTID